MYRLLLILLLTISLHAQQGRVGINTNSPQATLDIMKNSDAPGTQPQGVIFPRMTTQQRDRMQSPIPPGLMIYNTTTKSINLYNGSIWVDFLGTPIKNATINKDNINIVSQGRVGINTLSPQATLEIARDVNAPETQVQGVLFPRLTTEERDRVKLPTPTGLMIYNTDTKTVELYNGTSWVNLTIKNSEKENNTPPKEEGEPSIDYRNSRHWLYGITSPTFPKDESEVPIFHYGRDRTDSGYWVRSEFGLDEIRWTPGCGWYDVNKEYIQDNKLCWAATASNMLHWWVNHNKENIKKYYAKYPEEPRIPSADYQPERYSDIFDLYRTTFYDKVAWATAGVNWFISGEKGELAPFRNYNETRDFSGYFSKVFKGKEITSDSNRMPRKEEFNKIIKDAITEHKALGFVYNISHYGNHAITLWGAEFDENGDVSYIYYSNNSYNTYSDENEGKIGICRRRKVVYDDKGTYFLPQNNEKKKNLIIALMSLSLGSKEDWSVLD